MATAYATTSEKRSAYQVITDRIIAQLEKGTVPWHKPWTNRNADGSAAYPCNLVTGHFYRGINLFLTLASEFDSRYWLTYNQAKSLGGFIRSGEKGLPICYWQFNREQVEQPDGEITERRWAFCKTYVIFNLRQAEIPGLDVATSNADPDAPKFQPIEECEKVIANWTAKPVIRYGGDRACYSPTLDIINMPTPEAFDSREEVYSTLFHECGHACTHPSRLGTQPSVGLHFMGDRSSRSKEELAAEMTAAYLCGYTGIENRTVDNSAAYIASWLKVLRNDPKMVILAGSQAQRRADYILGVRQ
jgi:antirestriction protein ArdC